MKLLVPINIEALCIGKGNSEYGGVKFLKATTDFSLLPYKEEKPCISQNILSQPFSGDNYMQAGVHLHWALPDALTHGVSDEKRIEFPVVPNRWLITRIITKKIGHEQQTEIRQSWVIESDFLSKENPNPNFYFPGTVTVPIEYKQRGLQTFRYLGKIYDAKTWEEKETNDQERFKLTAIGFGEPTFAAYYPNCATVFGFYDSSENLSKLNLDPDKNTLGYQVVGWFSNPEEDPLCSRQPEKSGEKKACKQVGYNFYSDLKWTFKAETTENPSQSLYSGIVRSIKWNPETDYFANSELKTPKVAIGNTPSEALSALIAQHPNCKNFNEIEKNLNALQLQLLNKLNKVGGQEAFNQELFQSYFGTQQAETIFSIKPANTDDKDKNNSEAILLDEISTNLNKLNLLQYEYEELNEKILSYRQQIFADWYKYMVVEYTNDPVDLMSLPDNEKGKINEIRDLIYAEVDQVKLIEDEILKIQKDIENAKNKIEKISQEMTLEQISAPRYWQGNDPVILLSGSTIEPALRYGGDGRLRENGFLECYLTEKNYQDITIEDIAIDNDIAINKWNKNPWLPIMLQWEITYHPIQAIKSSNGESDYSFDFITKKFKLNSDQSELGYQEIPSKSSQQYTGSVILTPQIKNNLLTQIDKFIQDANSPDLQEIKQDLGQVRNILQTMPILSQSLGGFNSALIMLQQVLQLKVYDPIANSPALSHFSNDDVSNAVGKMNQFAPLPQNNYNPIRAGYFTLDQIRLVDAFGRILDIDCKGENQPIIAKGLQPSNLIDSNLIYLAPRIVQPSRLLFRWLSANDDQEEMNDNPATTPIFGWLIPNHLDNSLVIYNNQGTAIGSFIIRADQTLDWETAPGNSDNYGKEIDKIAEIFQHENQHLREFAIAIAQKGANYLQLILQTCDRATSLILPHSSKIEPSTAVLIGRPMALVRASLKLDLKGLPAYNQSWDAFNQAVDNPDQDNPIKRHTANFEKVKFPVQLGKVADLDDGLIGYFLHNGETTDYSKFYSQAAEENLSSDVVCPSFTTLQLDCDPDSKPTLLTLLIDPHAKIHATTGILPIKSIDIPPIHYVKPLENMKITFLCAPILSDFDKISLPIPQEGEGSWQWIERNKNQENKNQKFNFQNIENITQNTTLFKSPQALKEGWLILDPAETPAKQETQETL